MIKVILHTADDKFKSIEIFAPHEKDYPMAALDLPHGDGEGYMLSFDGANDWYMGDDKGPMDERIHCILLARAIATTGGEELRHATDFPEQLRLIELAYDTVSEDTDIIVLQKW